MSTLNLPWCSLKPFPLAGCLREEADSNLVTASFQADVESSKIFPEPPFLQVKHPQLSQLLLTGLVLQTLPQLRCPSLHSLQPLNVFLTVRGPELVPALQVWPQQCRVQRDNPCPGPAGHTTAGTARMPLAFLATWAHTGSWSTGCQPAPQVFFHQAPFQTLCPQLVALHGLVVAKVQDPALHRSEPHTIGPVPLIQPVQVPLQILPTLQQINTNPSWCSGDHSPVPVTRKTCWTWGN